MPQKKYFSIFNHQKKFKHFWMAKTLVIFTVSLIFTQIISVYNSVHAESTPVTIEFSPTSVELPIPEDTASTPTANTSQALMIVRNSSSDTLRGIQIKCFSNINNVQLEPV